MAKTLAEMSIEELNKDLAAINSERDKLRSQAKSVVAVLNEKQAKKVVADKVAAMGPDEKKAMAQALLAEGIPSGEVVSVPGTR